MTGRVLQGHEKNRMTERKELLKMKKYLLALFIGLALMQASGCAKAEEKPSEEAFESGTEVQKEEPSYYGTWEVKDAQRAEVYALSEDEINAFLGSRLSYSADTFRFNEEERAISEYEAENEAYTEEMLAEEYGLNLGEWWNNKPQVTFFAISSEDNFFGRQFFVADEETLWIYHEGIMFLAKRAEK